MWSLVITPRRGALRGALRGTPCVERLDLLRARVRVRARVSEP